MPIPTFARPNLPKTAVLEKKSASTIFFWRRFVFEELFFFGGFGLAKVGIGTSVVRNHCLGCDFQVSTMLHRREPSTFVFCSSTLGEKKLHTWGGSGTVLIIRVGGTDNSGEGTNNSRLVKNNKFLLCMLFCLSFIPVGSANNSGGGY